MVSPALQNHPPHTLQEYLRYRLNHFQDHIRDYIAGKARLPVCQTVSYFLRDIHFTFSDLLLEQFLTDRELEKPYEAAIKFGFRGYSKGEQNGIFLQREQDSRMQGSTNNLIRRHQLEVSSTLDLAEDGLDSLKKVKIVCHVPEGSRIVGIYNTANDRMVFLDFASY